MFSIEEIILRSRPERRSVRRTRIDRGAALFFVGSDSILSCTVRDASGRGASIRLHGIGAMPTDFELSFDNFRTARTCRLVWRDGDFIGIRWS
ncbi:PilZ domain-containing protein [Bradyrhizobium genosp. P]|uniref:PilZ domain-containing protein n=1 Tax=Bradyrhizobium genosp. P TaxID=83641 RepID=UPI003CF3D05F